MKQFRIITDKEYFERFTEIANRIRGLGSLFQNADAITTTDELIEWEEIGDEIENDFHQLRCEAQFRIEKIEKKTEFKR